MLQSGLNKICDCLAGNFFVILLASNIFTDVRDAFLDLEIGGDMLLMMKPDDLIHDLKVLSLLIKASFAWAVLQSLIEY